MVSRADDLRLRELLAEHLGAETTDKLLERLPLTSVDNLATKDDMAALRGELLDEFGKLRGEFGELKGEFGTLRGEFGELKGEFGTLRGEFGELKGEFGTLGGAFGELKGELLDRFGEQKAEIASMMRFQAWAVATLLVTGIGASTAITAAVVA